MEKKYRCSEELLAVVPDANSLLQEQIARISMALKRASANQDAMEKEIVSAKDKRTASHANLEPAVVLPMAFATMVSA